MTAPRIRHETASDKEAVFRVNRAAFGRDEEAELVDALRDGGKYVLSLVAEIDGEIVGHALYTPLRVESEAGAVVFVALGPLAVAPEHQRQGIGARLMEAAHEELRAMGETAVFLLGHVSYYPRFGFRPAREFDVHYEDDRDSFMALELVAGALSGVSGRAAFAEEFSRFE
ncbi:MAG TPA: N-acetyltransferase [Dehalococcoidia bacterium]|nr:N-acetyltransferase [Dehalococcoidia bacterium]